jgi:hypothetical protein
MLLHVLLLASRLQPAPEATPYRQPQLAAAHGRVAMTFGSGGAVYFASSPDEGRTFDAPVKVARVGALALGRHRGPRLAILKDAMVISAVAGERTNADAHAHGLPEAGDLLAWRSTDNGKTWSRAGVINDTPGAAREGLHAMTAAGGALFAVWLDLRAKGTRLYGARSEDGGATWSRNVLVYESPDGTICQCCDPALAADTDGRVYVMWRNVISGSRDLYYTVTADGKRFAPARKLGDGSWPINACPMDGGGLVVDNGAVVSAWRRDSEVFLTAGDGSEKAIGAGKDVAIARGPWVAWTKNGGIEILRPGGAAAEVIAKEGAFANLVALPDGTVLAAWEAHNAIETVRLK